MPKPDEWRLNQLTFNDFSLGPDEMVMAGIRIFKDLGLMKSFRIDYDVGFTLFLLLVATFVIC